MRIISIILLLCGLIAAPMFAEEAPKVAAGEVVMKVNGIVCPACAYGIQKKVSKLSFVDNAKLHNGVELDVEKHLAKVAIKQGQKPDFKALFVAVKAGGFDPVGAYVLEKGKPVYHPAAAE
jgi:hypothetical protein